MKIDEFIKEVNKVAYAVLNNDEIYIYSDDETEAKSQKWWFLRLNPQISCLDSVYRWSNIEEYTDGLDEADLFYILGLVQELRKTPVEERFPEKKYRLYVMRNATGPVPDRCYLGNYGRSTNDEHFDYVPREDAWVLTEKQIENLKSYTPLIDCFMKEEVPEDETR